VFAAESPVVPRVFPFWSRTLKVIPVSDPYDQLMFTVVPVAAADRFVGGEIGVTAVDVAELAVTYPLTVVIVKLWAVPTVAPVNTLVWVPAAIPDADRVPTTEYVRDPVVESVHGTVIVVPLTVTVPIVGGGIKSGNCEGTIRLNPAPKYEVLYVPAELVDIAETPGVVVNPE
jgi:hypothetical protein